MKNYLETVYAGLLGKVIGVYLGRPIEGWEHQKIKEKFGEITDYVHDAVDRPLVVADDDISGTIVFAKAVADSKKGLSVDYTDFGNCWLNYLIEDKTVLWWGGLGISTEHTAYARLKEGIMPPLSGSMETNGQITAEQIGAQIFIDAFGLMSPNQPELASMLAEKAARVSHDGEAVYAAKMVAIMISLAFEEKDMNKLMDKALNYIPADCLLAQVYKDVRAWSKENQDWYETLYKIQDKYGYDKFYGGSCHVIPNHAIMIMAWLYGENDFSKSQMIINTAGWDTDCNAANVGSLMGVILGYDKIIEQKDWQKPFADLIFLPTADCNSAVADVAIEAKKIALVGQSLNPDLIKEKIEPSLFHDFKLPGALHGYKGLNATIKQETTNNESYLKIEPETKNSNTFAISHLNIPKLEKEIQHSAYQLVGMPFFYPGQTVSVALESCFTEDVSVELVLTVAYELNEVSAPKSYTLQPKEKKSLDFTLPALDGYAYQEYKLVFKHKGGTGFLKIHKIAWDENFLVTGKDGFKSPSGEGPVGWVNTTNRNLQFRDGACYPLCTCLVSNHDMGLWVTGHETWNKLQLNATIQRKVGTCGLVLAYQGLSKNITIKISDKTIEIIEKYYQEEDRQTFEWKSESLQELHCSVLFDQGAYKIKINDFACQGSAKWLKSGGTGFLAERGTNFIQDIEITKQK